jgi:hypothetical protein
MLPVQEYTVIPRTSGAYDASGIWVDVPGTPAVRYGIIQPASDSDLKNLPEGRIVASALLLITEDNLNISSSSQNSDIISYAGFTYEIVNKAVWPSVVPHNEYILSKI